MQASRLLVGVIGSICSFSTKINFQNGYHGLHFACRPSTGWMEGHIDGSLFWVNEGLGGLQIFYGSPWCSIGIITNSMNTPTLEPKAAAKIPSPSSGQRGLFSVDLFAKATTRGDAPMLSSSSNPFLIVVDGDVEKTKWYTHLEEDDFFDALKSFDFLSADCKTFWIDVDFSVLSEVRFKELCGLLQFHNITVRDCYLEDRTVTDTKVAFFEHYLFCIVDTLVEADLSYCSENSHPVGEWETRNLNVITFKRGTVSIHNGYIPGPADIYARVVHAHAGHLPSPEWVQWAAFDVLTDSMVTYIDETVNMVEEIDQKSVPVEPNQRIDQNEILRDMRLARKRLRMLRSSLSSKMETLNVLLTTMQSQTKHTIHHLRAVESEAKWKVARVTNAQETLQAAYQNYLAFVSVQAANINNQANGVLKKITMLLAITSPLNLIASIFGMNVFPLTQVSIVDGSDENNALFVTLLVVMFLSSAMLLCTAKVFRWL